MGKTREIKGRLKAVGNIQRITKTMQMIATSKYARAQQRALAAKPYTEGVFDLVQQLAATAGDVEHPLITGAPEGEGKPELWLFLTSDRGLCGPYNGSVLRNGLSEWRRTSPSARIDVVGKKGAAFLKFSGVRAERHMTHFGDAPRREDIDHLAQQYMDRFTSGHVSGVRVVYMRFVSAGKQAPEVMRLLPLKPPAEAAESGGAGVQYDFSPPAEELLGELLPVTVKATLNQCFSDAIVSEHIARMVAMKAATDNAGKMKKNLTREYNRARQAQITTELTEIISGAAALE
jgi:F-type H+-transporting ATPase subunit gamma